MDNMWNLKLWSTDRKIWSTCENFTENVPCTIKLNFISFSLSRHTPVLTVVAIQICLLYFHCRLYLSEYIFCIGNSREVLYFELRGMMSQTTSPMNCIYHTLRYNYKPAIKDMKTFLLINIY